jgi:hypothetical protein
MTDYFIDHDAYTAQLTGTLTFTNGSTTVTGSGTAFTTELSVGDYIKSDDATEGKEWYKVTAITSDTELTIDHAFYQNTHSATAKKNSNDGLSPTTAFCHIQQFFDVAQAGDVGYIRRGKIYYSSKNLNPINDGSFTSHITLIGDDGTGWATETGNAKPVIDTQEAAVTSLVLSADVFWILRDLAIKNSGNTGGTQVQINTAADIYLDRVDIYHDGTTKARYGLNLDYGSNLIATDCNFGTNGGLSRYTIQANRCYAKFINCKIDNSPTGYAGLMVPNFADKIILKNCTFTGNATYDIRARGEIYIIGGSVDLTKIIFNTAYSKSYKIYLEDVDGVGTHKILMPHGTIEKDTLNIVGNASSSIKVTPNSNTTTLNEIEAFEWKITNLSAGTQYQITVKSMYDSNYAGTVTPDDVYIEVEYYSEATGTKTATAKSTQAPGTTWTDLSVTFTPQQDGDCYVRGYVKKYLDGYAVWFNGEVEVTTI